MIITHSFYRGPTSTPKVEGTRPERGASSPYKARTFVSGGNVVNETAGLKFKHIVFSKHGVSLTVADVSLVLRQKGRPESPLCH